MLNFYLLGVALAGLVVIVEFYRKDLWLEMQLDNPTANHFEISIGVFIGVAVLMALSWVLVIIKGHQYLTGIFN